MAGILLHIAGLWTLSVLDASGKWLASFGVTIFMICWVRYIVHLGVLSAIMLPRRGRATLSTHSMPRQLLRAALMLLSSLLFFSTLRLLPLAEAASLNFLAPLIVVALAPWLLGEAQRWVRWLAVLIGFAGMLLVVRPSTQLPLTGVAMGIATAISFALYQLATRAVARDDPITTNFYSSLFGVVILSALIPLFWQAPTLLPWQWLLLGSTGLSGLAGHLLQVAAYRRCAASVLAPFSYLQIVSAVSLGWLLFGQLPDLLTALGIAIIVAAGLLAAWFERRGSRNAATINNPVDNPVNNPENNPVNNPDNAPLRTLIGRRAS